MSFKIAKSRTFMHQVSVMTPVDGGHQEETLKATFNYLAVDEIAKFDLRTPDGTTAFLRAVVRRIDDITDDGGTALTYNDDVRDALFGMSFVRTALAEAYFNAVSKAKSGN